MLKSRNTIRISINQHVLVDYFICIYIYIYLFIHHRFPSETRRTSQDLHAEAWHQNILTSNVADLPTSDVFGLVLGKKKCWCSSVTFVVFCCCNWENRLNRPHISQVMVIFPNWWFFQKSTTVLLLKNHPRKWISGILLLQDPASNSWESVSMPKIGSYWKITMLLIGKPSGYD